LRDGHRFSTGSDDGVELSFRQVSGLRPFVAAAVNGCPVSLMVHSNAGFRAMVTHDAAARAGLRLPPVEQWDYGIEAVGRLAGRGRTTATGAPWWTCGRSRAAGG
jgi:hypothetical protein